MRMQVTGSGDLRKLSRDLRRHADGKQLRREFIRDVRAEVRPVAANIRSGYRSQPGYTGRRQRAGGTLRALLAKAVTTSVRLSGRTAGVTLRVAGNRMPSGMGRLPKLYEGNVPNWRHPVFGSDRWASQDTGAPIFANRVRAARGSVERRVVRLVERMARRIARG
jgi:hypothetical protein